ncbi:MAG: hypothetical protein ACREFD_07675 [Stellaceae bacterium]
MNRLIVASMAAAALTLGVSGASFAAQPYHGITTAGEAAIYGGHGMVLAQADKTTGGDEMSAPKANEDEQGQSDKSDMILAQADKTTSGDEMSTPKANEDEQGQSNGDSQN